MGVFHDSVRQIIRKIYDSVAEAIKVTQTTYRIDQSSVIYGNKNITATATLAAVSTSNAADRRFVSIQCTDGAIAWGYNNSVTFANGTKLNKDRILLIPLNNDTDEIYVIANTGETLDGRFQEGVFL
jgi:hypothetical protein